MWLFLIVLVEIALFSKSSQAQQVVVAQDTICETQAHELTDEMIAFLRKGSLAALSKKIKELVPRIKNDECLKEAVGYSTGPTSIRLSDLGHRLSALYFVGKNIDSELKNEIKKTLDFMNSKLGERVPKIDGRVPSGVSPACKGNEGSIVKKMGPARNQGGLSWCFAYLVSDLMSAKLGKVVSAGDIALNYFAKIPSSRGNSDFNESPENFRFSHLSGGSVQQALKLLKNHQVCLEKDFQSVDSNNKFVDTLSFLDLYYETKLKEKKRPNIYSSRRWSGNFCPEVDSAIPVELLNTLVNWPDRSQALTEMARQLCSEKVQVPEFQIEGEEAYTSSSTPDALLVQISNLVASETPVGLEVSVPEFLNPAGSEVKKHGLSVVDQKMEKGKCLFLLRNSWGPRNCSKDYICDQKYPGHFWMPAEEVALFLRKANWIQN